MSADFLVLVIFAFFFGVLIGWLLQRRIVARERQGEPGAAALAKLGVIEAELKNAKRLLEANDSDATKAAERLTGLDKAISQANDRLKLIIKAVKSAKFSD